MTEQLASEPFRNWAIVEIFGHERIAGEVSEQAIGGGSFIRVDVPAVDSQAGFTRFYGDKAIYSIQPVSEEIARRAAASMRVRPVNVYLLPALASGELEEDDDQDDDGDNGPS